MTTQKCYKSYDESLCGLLVKHPFYYAFISQAPYRENTSIDIAAIAVSSTTSKINLLLNPEKYPGFDLKSRMFILAHEILHLIYMHGLSPYAKHEFWNIAADMSVNSILLNQGMSLPRDPETGDEIGLTVANVTAKIREMWEQVDPSRVPYIYEPQTGLSALEYFNWLLEKVPPQAKNEEKPKPETSNSSSGGSGGSSNAGETSEENPQQQSQPQQQDKEQEQQEQSPQSNQQQQQQQQQQEQEKSSDEPNSCNNNENSTAQKTPRELVEELIEEAEHKWEAIAPEDRDLVRQIVADRVKQATEQATPPGQLAGYIDELIKSTKATESWERRVAKFSGMLGNLEGKTTMARKNKYGSFPRYVFKPSKRLMVFVDTSGSMHPAWISKALGAIESIAKHCQVDIMWIDYTVQEILPFEKAKKQAEQMGGYHAKGRGGTSMRAGFRYLKENKVKVDGVVVMSDLELGSFWGQDYGFPSKAELNGLRVLWVGTKGNERSHPVPKHAGNVIYMPN